MMAWDLGANWRSELLRLRLAKRLTTAQIAEFLPPYPGDAPLTVADYGALYRQLDASKLAALALPAFPNPAHRTTGFWRGAAPRAASRSSRTIRTWAWPHPQCGIFAHLSRRAST